MEHYARLMAYPKLFTHYRYNSDGNLVGIISPLGVILQYLFKRDYEEDTPARQ
jgi:hypothetical protein